MILDFTTWLLRGGYRKYRSRRYACSPWANKRSAVSGNSGSHREAAT